MAKWQELLDESKAAMARLKELRAKIPAGVEEHNFEFFKNSFAKLVRDNTPYNHRSLDELLMVEKSFEQRIKNFFRWRGP